MYLITVDPWARCLDVGNRRGLDGAIAGDLLCGGDSGVVAIEARADTPDKHDSNGWQVVGRVMGFDQQHLVW